MLLTDTSSAVGGTTTALAASYLVIDRPTNTVLAASDPKAPFRAASVVKLLIALDSKDDRSWKFHMAAAANAVFDADDGGSALGSPEAIVFSTRAFLNRLD